MHGAAGYGLSCVESRVHRQSHFGDMLCVIAHEQKGAPTTCAGGRIETGSRLTADSDASGILGHEPADYLIHDCRHLNTVGLQGVTRTQSVGSESANDRIKPTTPPSLVAL